MVRNADQHSKDYSNISHVFRPGHADYTFWEKYGVRDYRGGGRSSGRETIGRVAAGAIAVKILKQLGIDVITYTKSIGPVGVKKYDFTEINDNAFYMPDSEAAIKAGKYVEGCMADKDSAGGVIECRINGMPAGIGDTVFEKLDANLAKAIMSIGAVKGFEVGDGFAVSNSSGSENNDDFIVDNGNIVKASNHAGGILGGMSDGSDIVFRAAVKPTPSISQSQQTVDVDGIPQNIEIQGRHDPVIVPRAVVVVESMAAITILDLLMTNMSARLDSLKDFYN
jgi:chorismate synthase